MAAGRRCWRSAPDAVIANRPDDRETGIIQRLADGSLACHPLLRDAARAELDLDRSRRPRAPMRELVRWLADHDEPEAAVELCLAARDWPQAAALLVESHAVPRLVSGTADDGVRRAAGRPEVRAAEPLLNAAVLWGGRTCRPPGWPARPRRALGRRGRRARWRARSWSSGWPGSRGRRSRGPRAPRRAPQLLAQASVAAADDLGDLAACLDAFTGAADGRRGDRHQRAGHPEPRRRAARPSTAPDSWRCWRPTSVTSTWPPDGRGCSGGRRRPRVGVAHAHVALAWVLVERGRPGEAQVRLDWPGTVRCPAASRGCRRGHELVEARLMTACGRPDEAIRRWSLRPGTCRRHRRPSTGSPARSPRCRPRRCWPPGSRSRRSPRSRSGLPAGSPERSVLTATARRDIGDVRGAAAAMASVADDLLLAPRATQLQGWVLQARLAFDRGQVRQGQPARRTCAALASAEEFRRPLHADGEWLRWFLDRDGSALRGHRPFVRSLVGARRRRRRSRASSGESGPGAARAADRA